MAESGGTIAYVLKGFPRLSELFIASEICRVEEAGVPLRLFVIKPGDEGMRHDAVRRISAPIRYLPLAGSISAISTWRWLARYGGGFAGALARVARRRPLGLGRAAALALAQAVRARRRRLAWPRRLYLKELMQAVALADAVLVASDVRHLHAHFCHGATTVAWLAAAITGLPFSLTAHAKDIYQASLNPAGLLRRKLLAARFVVTCTEANRHYLRTVVPEARLVRVYHGLNVDLAALLGDAPVIRRQPDELRLLAVGRLVRKKGFDVVVDACAALARRCGRVSLRLVGEDGDASAALREQIAARGLGDQVTLVGPRTQRDLLDEYRNASALVLPCRIVEDGDRDGIPNVLVEAMACGLPVVTTGVSGIPELVRHGVNGLLVSPDDPDALAAAIERLAADAALWQRLSRAAVATVRQRFDGARLATPLVRLFNQALEGPSSAGDGLVAAARVFAPQLRAHRGAMAWSVFLQLLGVGAALLAPWPLKLIIDGALRASDFTLPLVPGLAPFTPTGTIAALAAAYLFVVAAAASASYFERQTNAGMHEGLTLAVRDRLFRHLARLSPAFGSRQRSGEIVHRLVTDTQIFARCLTKSVPQTLRHVCTAAATLGAMTLIAPAFALIGLASLVVLAALARRYETALGQAARQKRGTEGHMAGLAQELVHALPRLQAAGELDDVRPRFAQSAAQALAAGLQETRVALGMERALQLAQGTTVAAVTGLGAHLVLGHRLSVGDLTVLVAYVTQLLKPVEKINELASALAGGTAAAQRLRALLAERPHVVDRPGAGAIEHVRGALTFRDVWFRYPGSQRAARAVLRGVSVTFSPGRLHVIAGRSGVGKSTLLHLMVRLFDPRRGQICLDGVPITSVTLASLRRHIAVVHQRPHLLAGSVRSALESSERPLSDARLWEALGLVELDDFVAHLPGGLDTPVGEDGTDLSGGQRQRLALARAFLTERPLLLLDEPTANVDRDSELAIIQAITRFLPARTCIAVSHRSALVEHADVLYRLRDGRLEEVVQKDHDYRMAALAEAAAP